MTCTRVVWMRSAALALAGGTSLLAACGSGGDAAAPAPVVAASVELTPAGPQSLTVGDTLRLAATAKDASGSTVDRPITWSSDKEDVAHVSTDGLVTAWGAGSATITAVSDGKSASVPVSVQAAQPIPLNIAGVVGKDSLPPGDTPQGGQGDPVGEIACLGEEQLAYHIHVHLSLIVNGEQLAIPLGIGVLDRQVLGGFVTGGSCFYWLHTHDASGIVHVESPNPGTLTLGQFFDVWGQLLTTTSVAGFTGPVSVYVDGKSYTGDPRAIGFTERMQITLEVGTPLVPPPVYAFPDVY